VQDFVRQAVGAGRLTLCREVCVGEGVRHGPQLGMLLQAALDAADQRGVATCCLHQVRLPLWWGWWGGGGSLSGWW
jgi:hypothetical protein